MRKIFTIAVIILLTSISLTPVVSGKANWKEGKVWSCDIFLSLKEEASGKFDRILKEFYLFLELI